VFTGKSLSAPTRANRSYLVIKVISIGFEFFFATRNDGAPVF
jgi:hypothetical protein